MLFEGSAIFNCEPLIWVLSLILEKLFSRSSFHNIACFSILASRPHFDATITSENILRRSIVDAIIFNCGPFIGCFSYFRGPF